MKRLTLRFTSLEMLFKQKYIPPQPNCPFQNIKGILFAYAIYDASETSISI